MPPSAGDSLRPYLKMQNLFVRDINKAVSPAIVRATLEKACGPLCKCVIPLDYATDQKTHIGQAYLNFSSEAEAECCLEKLRFKLVFGKQRAKVLFAPGPTQADKDKIWGPFAYKFQIIVKNLSEEVEVEAFYEFFSRFGEILQCKTDTDNYGQYFGQVQYMETKSVASAVKAADGTRWHGAVIQVVPHHKAGLADSAGGASAAARPSVDVSSSSSSSSYPSLAASTASPAAAAGPASTPNGTTTGSRPAYAQHLQQQQQQQQQRQSPARGSSGGSSSLAPAPVNFALQALQEGGGGSSSSGGGGLGGPVDSPLAHTRAPLGAFSGSGSDLHVDAPVVAPVSAPVAPPIGARIGHSSAASAAAGGGGSGAAAGAPQVSPLDLPRLAQADFSGATTGPGSASSAGLRTPGVPHLGALSLLDRMMRNRAEAAGGGAPSPAAASPAAGSGPGALVGGSGSFGGGGGGGVDVSGGGMQQQQPLAGPVVTAINGAAVVGSGRPAANGVHKKGGVLKAMTQALEQVSELLCCPITHEVLREPVVAADGITYERKAITNWLATHDTSPMTNVVLSNKELHPNSLVKTLIEELM